jgi:hypothetical protein
MCTDEGAKSADAILDLMLVMLSSQGHYWDVGMGFAFYQTTQRVITCQRTEKSRRLKVVALEKGSTNPSVRAAAPVTSEPSCASAWAGTPRHASSAGTPATCLGS